MMRGTIKGVPAAAKRLKVLKGSFAVTAVEQSQPVEIEDLFRAANTTSRSGRQSLQVISAFLQDQTYQVKAILTRGGLSQQDWRGSMEADGIRLLDAQGRPLRKVQSSFQDGGGQVLMEFSFEAGGQAEQGPLKLVWQMPLESRQMTIPFELSDLALDR
jgi:hypothetical protein